MACHVDAHVETAFVELVDAHWVRHVARVVLDEESGSVAEGTLQDYELTILIASDARISALNKDYRGIDGPTDVLSFAAREGPPFITPEGSSTYLGDVVVSYPTAVEQAKEAGHAIETELALLIVHGCLHLLGYDHGESAESLQQMSSRQDLILKRVPIAHTPRPASC